MPLERLGEYRLLEALPGGGNANVFIAIADGSTEQVVVKQLRGKPGSEPWKRFAREVTVVEGLGEFPGILPIIRSHVPSPGKQGDVAWYSMRMAERVDVVLANAPLERVVAAAATFAETLARLDDLGHHHRDIKPANLYWLEGQWLLGDFGLVEIPGPEALTEGAKKLGPLNFLPYEMIMNPDSALGGPVDVYELAKTLWVLAASEPFAPLGPQIADGGKFSLQRRVSHPLATHLDGLVEACTRTDPELRPRMSQVAEDLKAWLALAQRRAAGEDADAIRDATESLRAAFADDLTAGRLQEERVMLARRRITTLSYGIEQLANEIGRHIPGAVSQANHHATASAALMRPRSDQEPEPLMSGLNCVVIRLRYGPMHPELVLAVAGELEVDGDLGVRAGVFLDWPTLDHGEHSEVFQRRAPVDSIETDNSIEAATQALRDAAPEWLLKLRERSS